MSRRAQGLTLVELLVALMIFVVVSTASVVIFRSITRAWRTGELRAERYQQARLLFDMFERELSSCIASLRYPLVGLGSADEGRQDGSRADELFFVGTLPGRGGFIERGYWLAEDGRLQCHDGAPADGDYATGETESCGSDVGALEIRYFDGVAWRDRWDGRPGAGEAGTLPRAVKIELTLGTGKAERFETIVAIPTS